MQHRVKIENIRQEEDNNQVIELENEYVKGSVKIKLVVSGTELRDINFTEIGVRYLQLNEDFPEGTHFRIYYDTAELDEGDLNVLRELRELREKVNNQQIVIEKLLEAVDQRVEKHTFRVWLKAMEKSFGTRIVGENLLGIQKVHQSSNY